MNETAAPANGSIEDVRVGQRLINLAMLVYVATVILVVSVHDAFGVLGLVTLALAIMGLVRLATGLGFSTAVKVLLVVVVFIPLAGFLTLAIMSGRATPPLKAAGYKVGLLGAPPRTLG